MALPPTQNLTAMRGDDWSYQAVITPTVGTIFGCKIWMTIKSSETQADPGILQIDTAGGGVVIDDGTHATFTFTAAQMATLPITATGLFYDVAVLTPTGKNWTALRGKFLVTADMTLSRA